MDIIAKGFSRQWDLKIVMSLALILLFVIPLKLFVSEVTSKYLQLNPLTWLIISYVMLLFMPPIQLIGVTNWLRMFLKFDLIYLQV